MIPKSTEKGYKRPMVKIIVVRFQIRCGERLAAGRWCGKMTNGFANGKEQGSQFYGEEKAERDQSS